MTVSVLVDGMSENLFTIGLVALVVPVVDVALAIGSLLAIVDVVFVVVAVDVEPVPASVDVVPVAIAFAPAAARSTAIYI